MNLQDRTTLRVGDMVWRLEDGAATGYQVVGLSSSKTHFWLRDSLDGDNRNIKWVDLSAAAWKLRSSTTV